MGKITALPVSKLGEGRHSDGARLILHVRGGSRHWMYRYRQNGKRHETSLGSARELSLAEARAARDEKAVARRQGVGLTKAPVGTTLAEVTEAAFEVHKETLKRDGEAGRWM